MSISAATVTVHANSPVPDPVLGAGVQGSRIAGLIVNVGPAPVWVSDRTVDPVNGYRLGVGERMSVRDAGSVFATVRGPVSSVVQFFEEDV